MKVTIDRSGCISCGVCASVCPEVFRIAEDDLAEVYSDKAEVYKDSVISAQDSCPVSVIEVN